jgi:hypothetical protein
MKHFTVLLASFFVIIFAYAENDKVCEDLHRFSCSPGIINDGTGSAENTPSFDEEKFKLYAKLKKESADAFKIELLNPKNSYFRKIVLSSSGLSMNPACDSDEDHLSASCIELLSKSAADASIVVLKRGGFGTSTEQKISNQTYLLQSPIFKEVNSKIIQNLRKEYNLDKIDENIKTNVYPAVKKAIIEKINLYVQDPAVRKKMTDKVSAIQYQGSDCSDQVSKNPSIDGFLYENAFYSPAENTFKYCSGLLMKNTSYFQAYFFVAHEISHSIDPCGINQGPEDFRFDYKKAVTKEIAEQNYPITGVLSCLRSSDSLQARVLSPAVINGGAFFGQQQQTVFDSNAFCTKDQITESFADWMAFEVIPELIATNPKLPKLTKEQYRLGFSNVARGLCVDERVTPRSSESEATVTHPYWYLRTNYVLLTQPKVRELMGCPLLPSKGKYCKVGDISAQQSAYGNFLGYGGGYGLPPNTQVPTGTTKAKPPTKAGK